MPESLEVAGIKTIPWLQHLQTLELSPALRTAHWLSRAEKDILDISKEIIRCRGEWICLRRLLYGLRYAVINSHTCRSVHNLFDLWALSIRSARFILIFFE
jgi:hypothetical protein